MTDERLGRILCGKYTLLRALGSGGMAEVYEAQHRNGLRVAIKMLAPELSANADVKSRFLREGYVANAVEHPRVVRVLDDDVDQGNVFLVLELLRGESVGARAARFGGRIPEAAALAIAIDVCGVLEAAHARGIVHRDLKPDNLFLDEGTGVRVLDFGIARFKSSCASTMGTRTGVLLGTPGFMPKEQALGEMDAIDARTDLWALGATLHQLLAGKPVHEARTPEAMLVKVATEPVPPLAAIAPWVSEATATLVDRALKMNRDERFASASEMRAAIEHAHANLPPDEIALASTMHVVGLASTPSSGPRRESSIPPVVTSNSTPPPGQATPAPHTPHTPVPHTPVPHTPVPQHTPVAFGHTPPPSETLEVAAFPVGLPVPSRARWVVRAAIALAAMGALFVGREIQARAASSSTRLRESPSLTVHLGGAAIESAPVAPAGSNTVAPVHTTAPTNTAAPKPTSTASAAGTSTAPPGGTSRPRSAPPRAAASPKSSDPFENP